MPEDLIDVSEASRILGTGRTTVIYLIHRGDLEALRLPPSSRQKGHKFWLKRADVERLAQSDWRRKKARQQD